MAAVTVDPGSILTRRAKGALPASRLIQATFIFMSYDWLVESVSRGATL